MNVHDHLAQLKGAGQLDSQSGFTVDAMRGSSMLGQFQAANPAYYLLRCIQGGVASGAEEVRVSMRRFEVGVCFRPRDPSALRQLPGCLRGDPPPTACLEHLVRGLQAALTLHPAHLTVSLGGEGGWHMSLDQGKLDVEPAPTGLSGFVEIRLTKPREYGRGLARFLGCGDFWGRAAEVEQLTHRCIYATIPILLDGRPLNDPTPDWLPELYLRLKRNPPGRVIAERTYLGPPGEAGLGYMPFVSAPNSFAWPGGQRDCALVTRTRLVQWRVPDKEMPYPAPAEGPVSLRVEATPEPVFDEDCAYLGRPTEKRHEGQLRKGQLLSRGSYYRVGSIAPWQLANLSLSDPYRSALADHPFLSEPYPPGFPTKHPVLAAWATLTMLQVPTQLNHLAVVRDGVVLDPISFPCQCPGVVAVVSDPGLKMDLSGMRPVEDEALADLRAWLVREMESLSQDAVAELKGPRALSGVSPEYARALHPSVVPRRKPQSYGYEPYRH